MRNCGDCQLCCKLLPVRELAKPANTRCRHQKFKVGCAVYRKPMTVVSDGIPPSCRLWNCRWLVEQAGSVSRPDRCHYVVDLMPDYVTAQEGDGPRTRIEAVQVWVDPAYPDAHRDPDLRAWLAEQALAGIVAIIRYNARDGFTLVAPALSGTGEWMEIKSGVEAEHSMEELFAIEKVKQVAE
jgi:hypothetical protein